MMRVIAFVGLLLGMSVALNAQEIRTSHYVGECSECGLEEKPLGSHDFCALSAVGSGGFNSSCSLRHNASGWTLLIRDAETTFTGETQGCAAICLDFVASGTSTPPPPSAISATWSSHATSYRGRNGERFSFQCPSGGTLSGSVWGSGPYTDDSRICSAGVHAGAITVASGGVVTIEIRPGQSAYTGSTRNGARSLNYGSWHGSYIVVR